MKSYVKHFSYIDMVGCGRAFLAVDKIFGIGGLAAHIIQTKVGDGSRCLAGVSIGDPENQSFSGGNTGTFRYHAQCGTGIGGYYRSVQADIGIVNQTGKTLLDFFVRLILTDRKLKFII